MKVSRDDDLAVGDAVEVAVRPKAQAARLAEAHRSIGRKDAYELATPATAKRFVAEGASVVITGRRQAQLDSAVREIGSSKAMGVQGDVANMQDLDRLYATIKSENAHIDIPKMDF